MKAAVSHDSTFGKKFLCAAVLLHTGIFSQERMIVVVIADSCPPPFHGLTQSKSVLGF
jgi:hypothetical protein